ncbi:MAG: hypothetical protein KAI72_01750, partial [Candidatus Pacebacteria bacterium]|nr:hypothetical protein [Candidatus Paceibacterota bacterium]
DHISYNNSRGEVVDRYSGVPMLDFVPEKPYYLLADRFSVSKLKPLQRELLFNLTEGCNVSYENFDLKVYGCFEIDN